VLIKRIALLVMVLILSLPASVLAAEPDSGIIEGQIVNGTAGGSSVADQNITLNIYLDEVEVDAATTKTDADGRFIFDGLSTESDYSYGVTLVFQQAEYYSDWLSFNEGETTKSVEVTVYDSTTSDEALKIATAHAIIYVGQGSLQVEEYFLFVNETDRTYIGSKEISAEGTREVLRFSLPKGATELQITMGLMECCIVGSEEGFVDTMPILPGSKEVAYSYRVDYSSETYAFSQRVNYPTTSYELLVQGEAVQVTSDQLAPERPLEFEGSRFNHLSGEGLAPGDTLVARLSGLPEASAQGAIIWVALALIVLTGGFGLGYLLRKKRVQPVSLEDSLDRRGQRLLVELAQLDDEFEAGKIPEENYRRLRSVRKAQLVELMQRPKEERDKG